MLASMIQIIIIFTGSAVGASFFQKKSEELIPITIMMISCILFIFGFWGNLRAGLYFVCVLSIILYVLSAFQVIRTKSYMPTLQCFISPCAIIFLILCVILAYLNYGKLAAEWDEFSHWADSVKAMVHINDFITNPLSHSGHKSYPPSMTLFQYFSVKLDQKIMPNNKFAEWKLFYSYQVFSLSMFLPLLKFISLKKPIEALVTICTVCLIPLFFYDNFYYSIYIDAFLGIMAGCAFASILFLEKKDALYNIYITLNCIVLVLAKEVGLYFAIFTALAFLIDKVNSKKLISSCFPLFAIIVSKAMWNQVVARIGGSANKSKAINIFEYMNMFFLHQDTTYKQTVVENFRTAFYEKTIRIGTTNIQVSYFGIAVLLIALLYIMYHFYSKHPILLENTSNKDIYVFIVLHFILYIFFLGASYVYNFVEREGLILASYDRYIRISYLSVWVPLIIGLLLAITKVNFTINKNLIFVSLFAFVLLISPMQSVSIFANHVTVRASQNIRNRYSIIIEKIEKNCKENEKIYFISQGNDGYDISNTRFSVRPAWIYDGFSLGGPFYDGDIWSKQLTVEEWRNTLFEDDCDYVAIYRLNDYFYQNYSSIFQNADEICENELYKFDKKKKLLRRCD